MFLDFLDFLNLEKVFSFWRGSGFLFWYRGDVENFLYRRYRFRVRFRVFFGYLIRTRVK